MAEWTTAYINDLPDSSFAVVEPGGKKDAQGKTTPRSLRHFPYKDASGKVDLPHLRNALARLPQSKLSAELKAKAKRVLEAAAKKAGVGERARLALYEPDQAAGRVEAGKWRKDVVRSGAWKLPDGRTFRVTPERMDHWVRTFKAMRQAGINISAPVDHSGRSEDNKGFVEDIWREGDTLYCAMDVPREGDDDAIGKTIREVSICVEPEWTDSTGKVWRDFVAHVAPCTEPVINGQGEFERIAARRKPGDDELILCRKETNRMDWKEKLAELLKLDKAGDMSDEDVLGQVETRLGNHTETLRRVKGERDKAIEASQKRQAQVEELEAKVARLEKHGDGEPEETEREIQLRRRVEAMEDKAAEAEVQAAVKAGRIVDKVKDDAQLLLRSDGVQLGRKGETPVACSAAFRRVLDSLPEGASLDLEERAKRTVELRNPNAGDGATEQEKVDAGRSAARRVQGRREKDKD